MYEIQTMNGAHHCMMELYLQGYGVKDIALRMNYTPQGVTQVINSPIFQHELSRRRKNIENVHDNTVASTVVEARNVLAMASRQAAERLVEKMQPGGSEDERIEMMAIKEVLDRSIGVEAPQKDVTVNILSVDRLQLLIQSIEERKQVAEIAA